MHFRMGFARNGCLLLLNQAAFLDELRNTE